MLGDITAEGYYAFAEHDTYVPLDQVAAFEKLLAAAPFPSRSETESGHASRLCLFRPRQPQRGGAREALRAHAGALSSSYRITVVRRFARDDRGRTSMLNGIHGHQDIERVVYGKPAGAAVRAEAERLGAQARVRHHDEVGGAERAAGRRHQGAGRPLCRRLCRHHRALAAALRDRGRATGARGQGRPDRRGRRRLGDRRHQGHADRAVAGRDDGRGPRSLQAPAGRRRARRRRRRRSSRRPMRSA